MEEKISVIVPVYNVERYLSQCLDSIINQTYKNLEIIVIDDGSTDKSSSICDEYSQIDPRIKVFHKSNGGASSARNRGLDIATGEYIGFVDSDDFLLSEMYSTLIAMCKTNNCQISVCKTIDIKDRKIPVINNYSNNCDVYSGLELLLQLYSSKPKYNIAPCNKLYHKSVFSSIRFPEGRIYEDESIIVNLLYNTKKIAITSNVYYCYFLSQNSVMRSNFSEKRFDSIIMFNERMDFLKSYNLDDLFSQTQAFYYYRICELYFRMMDSDFYDKEKWAKYLLTERKKILNTIADNPYFTYKWQKKCDNYIYHYKIIKCREHLMLFLRPFIHTIKRIIKGINNI